MENNKKKKLMIMFLGIALFTLTLGVSIAFFNYTRTGNENTLTVGRISFITNQTQTINLQNVFPIDSADVNTDTTNVGTFTVTIRGDTDYNEGIEYLVSSVDSNVTTSTGKTIPISLDYTITNLGTSNANYFAARESKNATIYKRLSGDAILGDQMLLVGYIKPNTTIGTAEGVNGSITIKAYLDKDKIGVSDTYDGTESDNMGTTNEWANGRTILTTTEWNSLQTDGISFKIRVEANEGIWVKGSLEEIMKTENYSTTLNRGIKDNESSQFVSSQTGIDFSLTSSNTNGKGIYMRAGTENDDYPILYYRGNVDNNNVLFANNCWKAVRTTDTGGVKLIYNGTANGIYERNSLDQESYNVITNTNNSFTFDTTEKVWIASFLSGSIELSFKVPAGTNYTFDFEDTILENGGASFQIYKDDVSVSGGGGNSGNEIGRVYVFDTLTANNVIKFTFSGGGFTNDAPAIIKIKMLEGGELIGIGCDNIDADTLMTLNNTNEFSYAGTNLSKSLAYNGYMWGTAYEWTNDSTISGAYFGTGFTWDGTNYTLTNAKVGYDGTHHYTCNLATAQGTCNSIRYYYHRNGVADYDRFITLTNGDSIDKAIKKMQTNTDDSNAKQKIETWYASNLSSVTNKLEDTTWCNDRSITTNNSLNPSGGIASGDIYYNAYNRLHVNHEPSLMCTNKNDTFTWKNAKGNQKLNYPIAMLTADEIVLAGGGNSTGMCYLSSTAQFYTMTPDLFGLHTNALQFAGGLAVGGVTVDGQTNVSSIIGIRPAISIKPGLPVIKGTGTATDPYVIE